MNLPHTIFVSDVNKNLINAPEWGRGLRRHGSVIVEDWNESNIPTTSLIEFVAEIVHRYNTYEGLVKALKPFAHPDLAKMLPNNAGQPDAPVFGRDKALLTLADFRRAVDAVARAADASYRPDFGRPA